MKKKEIIIVILVILVIILSISLILVINSSDESSISIAETSDDESDVEELTEQLLKYEGDISLTEACNLMSLLITNAEEATDGDNNLPTITVPEADYIVDPTDIENYINTLSEWKEYWEEKNARSTGKTLNVSFNYSSDGLITKIIIAEG